MSMHTHTGLINISGLEDSSVWGEDGDNHPSLDAGAKEAAQMGKGRQEGASSKCSFLGRKTICDDGVRKAARKRACLGSETRKQGHWAKAGISGP